MPLGSGSGVVRYNRMMRLTTSAGCLIAILWLIGAPICLADGVKVHHDQNFDFSSLRTFEVISRSLEETEGPLGEIMFPRLHDVTDVILAGKGLEPSAEPDFLIVFQGEIIDHIDIYGGYREHVGRHLVIESWSLGGEDSRTDELFVVMMMIPGAEKPVWTGSDIVGIGDRNDTRVATNRTEKALRKILKHFPPR